MVIVTFVFLAVIIFYQLGLKKILYNKLYFKGVHDMVLAEPNEEIVFSMKLINHSIIPGGFINVHENVPKNVDVRMDDDWMKSHLSGKDSHKTTNFRLLLLPKQVFGTKYRISISKRGLYNLGRFYIEIGDFIGISSKIEIRHDEELIVIMPKRSTSKEAVVALGGFLGEISVRRFIMEDPVLTVGYREYTGREPFKSISWNQTAKTGSLQVKQYDYTADINVDIILNVDGANEIEREECYELARLAVEEIEDRHIPFAFISNANMPDQSEGNGLAHKNRILKSLGITDGKIVYSAATLVEKIIENRDADKCYIIISAAPDRELQQAFDELQNVLDNPICFLVAEKQEVAS